MRDAFLTLIVAAGFLGAGSLAHAQPVGSARYLVAEVPGREQLHDSYTLVLSNAADIAHARDLVSRGTSAGQAIPVCRIAVGADGVNRNYRASGAPPWHWHITGFLNFADATIEVLDGTPTGVESDPQGFIQSSAGLIGFWNYTVVAELPRIPRPSCPADFNGDGTLAAQDIFDFLSGWFAGDPRANFNGVNALTTQDIFDFLNAWFLGC